MESIMLGLIIFALIGFIAWREKHFSQERKDLIGGILSKDATEYKFVTTPPQKKEKKEPVLPEFMDEHSLTDEEFFEAIKKTNEPN